MRNNWSKGRILHASFCPSNVVKENSSSKKKDLNRCTIGYVEINEAAYRR